MTKPHPSHAAAAVAERRRRIVELSIAGKTVAEICEEVGVGKSTVVAARRGVELHAPTPAECSVDGCTSKSFARGLCGKHLQQFYAAQRRGVEFVPDQNARARKPKKATAPREPKPRTPKPKRAASKLPPGWETPLPPRKTPTGGPGRKLLEIPLVPETPPEVKAAARLLLNRHGADDVAWMLGLEVA